MYICLDSVESIEEQNDTEDGRVDWNSETESLDQVLRRCNKDVDSLPFLTDFRTGNYEKLVYSVSNYVFYRKHKIEISPLGMGFPKQAHFYSTTFPWT